MSNPAEVRLRHRISDGELERRWKATRLAMKERNLDFLLLETHSSSLGGHLRWFTDIPAGGYQSALIFPREDEMTTIFHGARPPAPSGPPEWLVRGVKKRINVPIVPALEYSGIYGAEKIVEELSPYKDCRIGFVGMGRMTAAFYKYITGHLTSAKFEDATNMVDAIKAIKSEEEIECTKQTCKIQDEVWKYALTVTKPGRRDFEVRADVLHKAVELGADDAMLAVGSAPAGVCCRMMQAYMGNRIIEEGDQVTFLIETNGPTGFWGELARMISLGPVSPALQEQYALAQEAQKRTLSMLKPGASPSAIFEAHNEYLRSIGYEEEGRIYSHSQGYDMVERPSLDPGETIKIQANMNMAVHPEVVSPKAFGWVCENYIIQEKGEPVLLHETPQKVFVL